MAETTTRPPVKPKREEVPKDRVLCEYCTAKCCKYFALPLDTPADWDDFDSMRWFLMHQDVTIFVDGKQWYIMMLRPCQHLQADNRCGIYDTRPKICRDYHTDDCEYEDAYTYDQVFENDSQILEYAEAILGRDPFPTSLKVVHP